jgi:hypothetical protein
MIKLALEMPVTYLDLWNPLCDLDFVLAHKVLEDRAYAQYFVNRPPGRELILDNSMHELGKPLSVSALREAAEAVRADYVVAPDELGQPRKNIDWFHETVEALSDYADVAVVLAGRDPVERDWYLQEVSGADMLCLPFREPRLVWFALHTDFIVTHWNRIHLLGVSSPGDLEGFACRAREHSEIDWSIDTAKPIKWGYAGELLQGRATWRSASLSSRALLDLEEIPEDHCKTIESNISYLKSLLK